MKFLNENDQNIFLLISMNVIILISIESFLFSSSISVDDQDIINKLQELNKPPLKTIKVSNGDIIDCIHILQQASLDHPLLKNHQIQRVPNIFPKNQFNNNGGRTWKQKWFEEPQNSTCPSDTIPVKRATFEYLKSRKHYQKQRRPNPLIPYGIPNRRLLQTTVTENHEYAILLLQKGEYLGAQATFNIWSPNVGYEGEFSLAQLWIVDGDYSDNSLNTIEVGWQILYGDLSPRLFIYWTADAYNQTGCYNLECAGFIQTNSTFVLGGPFPETSTYGGTQIIITISVFRDPSSGNWWLFLDNEAVGYWPALLFTKFQSYAPFIEWGGEIINNKVDNQHTTTQMGSGNFAEEGWEKAAYIRNLEIVNGSFYYESASNYMSNISQTDKNCYDINITKDSIDWGAYFYFGGPGRNLNCP